MKQNLKDGDIGPCDICEMEKPLFYCKDHDHWVCGETELSWVRRLVMLFPKGWSLDHKTLVKKR